MSTAKWLASDMGYSFHGDPDRAALEDPEKSMYFGAAYLDYLSRYRKVERSEEFIIRGYNGGPNGINVKVRIVKNFGFFSA